MARPRPCAVVAAAVALPRVGRTPLAARHLHTHLSTLIVRPHLHPSTSILCRHLNPSASSLCRCLQPSASHLGRQAHTHALHSISISHRGLCRDAAHDVGGDPQLLEAHVPADAPLQPWELEAHSLMVSLAKRRVFTTDEFRRVIEALPAASQASWSYYENWSAATAALLQEKGLLTAEELQREVFGEDRSPSGTSPRFSVGEAVTVLKEEVQRTGWRRPHLRTPGYVHGVTGRIERLCGSFDDPSLLAYGLNAPSRHLYRVRFNQSDVWPRAETDADTVNVDIYENWLEPAAGAGVGGGLGGADSLAAVSPHDESRAESMPRVAPNGGGHGHSHEHCHSHGNEDSAEAWRAGVEVEQAVGAHEVEHGHVHLTRGEIEQNAVASEGPSRPGSVVHEALVRLLEKREEVTREELHQIGEKLEMAGTSLPAARLVARAWVDAEFKARLLSNATDAALELGVDARNPNAPTHLTVVENDERTHNLIVCTLCSCYPAAVLGPSPVWYKSRSYRARAVREPRRLLREAFGLTLPESTRVRVHDSTADLRYFVLPMRPEGTESFDEEALRALVTRNSLVGVSLPLTPRVPKWTERRHVVSAIPRDASSAL